LGGRRVKIARAGVGLTLVRPGRAYPGHPRREVAAMPESYSQRRGVDGRDKPGHNERGLAAL